MTQLPPPNQSMKRPSSGSWIYAALLLMAAAVFVAVILKGDK